MYLRTVSGIDIASLSSDHMSLDDLMIWTDKKLYAAKDAVKNSAVKSS